jgi:NAD(P)-dependent dehydrogenase (short-subunit alcohol dehydrogenase family)
VKGVFRLRRIASSLFSLTSPEDIAKAALFFASDLSDYVTGDRLTVAGGFPYRFVDYGVQ